MEMERNKILYIFFFWFILPHFSTLFSLSIIKHKIRTLITKKTLKASNKFLRLIMNLQKIGELVFGGGVEYNSSLINKPPTSR